MENIINGVQRLAFKELYKANEEHPLFASNHEAYGVICEEVEETSCEVDKMKENLEKFKKCVFTDTNAEIPIRKLRASAVMCAAEAIQVVAMCDKQIISEE